MLKLVSDGGAPGVITVIQDGASTYTLGEGKANLTDGHAMTGDAVFRIASISKAFNGAVILVLANKGKLTLASTVGALLPTAPASWGKVTVGQLLQHTSGLPDYIKDPAFLKEFIANTKMQKTPAQLIDYVADKPPAFTPGSRYEYSDTDNIVAGMIAEQVSGKSYNDLLSEDVAKPLGLTTTELPTTTALPSGYIHGYAGVEPVSGSASPAAAEDITELINPGLAWASGGMTTTAAELNFFIRGYVSGKLISPELLKQQQQFVPGAGGPPGPGVNSSGVGIYRYVTACGTFLGHTGNLPGYTSFAASTPDGQHSVAVAINSQASPNAQKAAYQNLLAVENAALCAARG